jgi:hypothetical protein
MTLSKKITGCMEVFSDNVTKTYGVTKQSSGSRCFFSIISLFSMDIIKTAVS